MPHELRYHVWLTHFPPCVSVILWVPELYGKMHHSPKLSRNRASAVWHHVWRVKVGMYWWRQIHSSLPDLIVGTIGIFSVSGWQDWVGVFSGFVLRLGIWKWVKVKILVLLEWNKPPTSFRNYRYKVRTVSSLPKYSVFWKRCSASVSLRWSGTGRGYYPGRGWQLRQESVVGNKARTSDMNSSW